MKPRKLTLASLTLLATLLIGAGVLMASSQESLTINVKFDPRNYTWSDLPPPDPWDAQIWRQKVQTKADITTFLLEGIYSPIATPYNATHGPRVIIPFNGNEVKAALFNKLPSHMGILTPGRYTIKLEITGNLKAEHGGTLIRGLGKIVVTIPDSSG